MSEDQPTTQGPPPDDELIGKTLGQFEIQEEIGRGGMATVYRARQTSMNRVVAVKVLPRHLLHDPGFYERFEREVDVIAHLEHPHILPIYDYGQTEGVPYIAMRYLGGGSLEHMIRRGQPDLNDLERPLRQIAQALDYAHRQGIIHRDLKPGNIMLDEGGNAYLSDFGIARVLGSDLTGSMIIGTPSYMSPEQANGLPIDGRSDIYALGVVLFELITGRLPYQAETPMAVLLKHINEPMPAISRFRKDVDPAVEQVVVIATAKDPEDRFSSARDMAEAFAAALRGETAAFEKPTESSAERATGPAAGVRADSPAAPAHTSTTPPPMAASQPVTPYPTAPVRQGPSTGALVMIVIVAAIVIGAVIGGILFFGDDLLGGSGGDPTSVAQVDAIPTPFPRASTITQDEYTISIPNDWIPPQLVIDQSDADRLVHYWEAEDNRAYVRLVLEDAGLGPNSSEAEFRAEVNGYRNDHYAGRSDLTFIDEAVAEDGTIRRSYYFVGDEEQGLQAGQIDVFFLRRPPYLAALEMYTAHSTQNTLVTRLQFILDSLRVHASS